MEDRSVKLALRPSICHGSSQEIWVCGSRDTGKKDKHAQLFPFRVHYSAVPGEAELRGGVNFYTEWGKKHINWDLSIFPVLTPPFKSLISKGCGGKSSSLYMSMHTGGACWLLQWKSFIMIFSIQEQENLFCTFEKLRGLISGFIFDIWEYILIMLKQVAVFSSAPGSENNIIKYKILENIF